MIEGQRIEKKSLKLVVGSSSNFEELAKDCVCFANARGGVIHIGIEDEDSLPDVAQKIDINLPDKIRKRISELTINVGTNTNIKIASNDGEYIELIVLPSSYTIASTTDGKYYLRVSDTCAPLPPDELLRLVNDKPSFIWETKQTKVKRNVFDKNNLQLFVKDLNASDRVSAFIKQMSNDEILDYYLFTDGDYLTNLGVLWIGHRNDRAKLSYAPVVQFLKFDENENRVNKIVWDDYSLNPKQLLEAIWTQIPDWKEGIEVSDGIFRKFVANYEEEVIRELIANALVHRPYTTRGDIFVNLYSDRLEIHNPGRFPIGVTAENILHKTVKKQLE